MGKWMGGQGRVGKQMGKKEKKKKKKPIYVWEKNNNNNLKTQPP